MSGAVITALVSDRFTGCGQEPVCIGAFVPYPLYVTVAAATGVFKVCLSDG